MPTLPKITSKEPIDNPAKAKRPIYSSDIREIESGYALFAEYAYVHPSAVNPLIRITDANANYSKDYSGAVSYGSNTSSDGSTSFTTDLSYKVNAYGISMLKDNTKTVHNIAVHEATHVFDRLKTGQEDRIAQSYNAFGDVRITTMRNASSDKILKVEQSYARLPFPYQKTVYYGNIQKNMPNSNKKAIDMLLSSEFNSVMSEKILGNYPGASVPGPYGDPPVVGQWYANLHW
jgi:hypothetical protein